MRFYLQLDRRFQDGELDFIINYDIKYRMGMGRDVGEEDV